ncbi:hypothetical protein WDW86_15475 [Bdellovibrionota bacterium FG-2]
MITYSGTFWVYAWQLGKDEEKNEAFLEYDGTATTTGGGDWSFEAAMIRNAVGHDRANSFQPDWRMAQEIYLDSTCWIKVPKDKFTAECRSTEEKLAEYISKIKSAWKMPADATYDDLYFRISDLDLVSVMFELKDLFETYFPRNPQHLSDKNGDDPKQVFDPSRGYSDERKLSVLRQYEGDNPGDAWIVATTDGNPRIRFGAFERLKNAEGLIATVKQVDAALSNELFSRLLYYWEQNRDELNSRKVQQFLAHTALHHASESIRQRVARFISPGFPDIFLEVLKKSEDVYIVAILESRVTTVQNSLKIIMDFPEPLLEQKEGLPILKAKF